RWWRFRRTHRQFGWKFWAFISGGAALDAATEDFWRRLGYVVVQGYGMTETTSLVSVQHPFRPAGRNIGKVLPGREMKLDPATGEILVRGDSIATAYWHGRELKPVASAADDGWLRTGDLGELDADGNLHFRGRKKNVIVSPAGLNIYPEDLEQALLRQPAVRDAVVIALPRGGNAEPCAVLLLRDGADPAASIRAANSELAEYQHMRQWLAWPGDDFPRTATMKPRTAAIAEYAIQQLTGGTPAVAPAGTLAEIIGRVTNRAVALTPATTLDDLGLSSLDRVELMSALEDRYQLSLDEGAFAAATTVADIERMLHQKISVETGQAPSRSANSTAAPGAQASETVPDESFPAADSRHVYPRWAQRWPITWIRAAAYWLLTFPYLVLFGRPRII